MLKKGDFVRIEYDARVASTNRLFDTTHKEVAEKHGLKGKTEPQPIIVGARHVIPGLDYELMKHDAGESFEVIIAAQDAFGSRNPQLIKVLPLNEFKKKNMRPLPGLVLDFQGLYGTVLSVSGGRVRIDFNHPLAGRSVKYDVKILGKITGKKEQIRAVLNIRIDVKDSKITLTKTKAVITLAKDIPANYKKLIQREIKEYVKLNAEFVLKKAGKKTKPKKK